MANTYTTASITLKEAVVTSIKLAQTQAKINHDKLQAQADKDHADIQALIEQANADANVTKPEIFELFEPEVVLTYLNKNNDTDTIAAYYAANKSDVGEYYAENTVAILGSSTYTTAFGGVKTAAYSNDKITLTYDEGNAEGKVTELTINNNGTTASATVEGETEDTIYTVNFLAKTVTETTQEKN